jgi:hypothetical protein
MIHHCCAHCRCWQLTSNDHIGKLIACSRCGTRIEVPAVSQTAVVNAAVHPVSPTTVNDVTNGASEVDRILRCLVARRFWANAFGFGISLIVLVGLTVPVAWWLAGTQTWTVVLAGVGIVLAVLFALASISQYRYMIGRARHGVAPQAWAGLMLVGGAWLVGGVIHLGFRPATVVVDNFSGQSVLVELDNRPWLKADVSTTQTTRLRKGEYLVTVRDSGTLKLLEEFTIQVTDTDDLYVLNLFRAQVYAKGRAEYTDTPMGVSLFLPKEERITERWFAVRVDYPFVEPPQKIQVRGPNGGWQSLTYLRRGEPKPPDF